MISLHKWIEGALASIDTSDEPLSSFGADPRALALSSDAFLSSALAVARSLAEQVRQAREERTLHPLNNDGVQRKFFLPRPASDWSDNVVIRLSSDNGHDLDGYHRNSPTPLPFMPGEEPSSSAHLEDLQGILKTVIEDVVCFKDGEDDDREDEDNGAVKVAGSCNPNYLSVASAALMPSSNNSDDSHYQDAGGEIWSIYSLGLLFYELFSGGERPPECKPPANTKQDDEGENELNDSKLLDDSSNGEKPELNKTDPKLLPLGDVTEPVDLTSKLNIFDDVRDADTIFSSFNGKNHVDSPQEQSKKKKSAKHTNKLQSIFTEPLKLKNLPWSLCNLIDNMLDCVNGDLCGNEAYCRMSDVCEDLQRMLDKPHTYLDDLDLAKVAVTGLRLNQTDFGREAELASLRDAYGRSVSGESELAIISGTSGTGKSVLAHQLGSFITAGGGIFLAGKFDQLHQATPFYAIAAAFNQYCDMLINEKDSIHAKKVGVELNRTLGQESFHLSRVIPSLDALIGQDRSHSFFDQGCVNAQRRLIFLLCQFVEVISNSSGTPVTLFLDDLQWADAASIEVVRQLLLILGSLNRSKQFFFLGCVRQEEVNETHPFSKMLSAVCQFDMQVTTVSLSCMDEDRVNLVLSDVLHLSPRLTQTLANIVHHKTKGNPLFFSQLMISLSRDGLLQPSLSSHRWEWDEEKIQSRKIPDDVAKFITGNIGRLPNNIQMALAVLSCFGASIKITLVETLQEKLGMPLIESVEKAVAEGMLDKIDESYRFCHDRLQEAAYNMMKPDERCLFHFKYGIALLSCTIESDNDDILFAATSQLNRGGPKAVEDAEQAVLIANLNLTAGKKAMEMSDFSSAYNFFDNGISFLRKKHWQENHDMSSKLFVNGAKCALFTGNIVSLKYLTQQVLTFGNSSEDKLEVLYITVTALARCEAPKALEKAISVLQNYLGEEFSESSSEPSNIKLHIEQTKVMLNKYTEESLLNHKSMEDPSKIMTMKFLARLEGLTQMVRPSWQPMVTIKMVQLSISHGISPMSPIGFTYYGMLLARLGDIREGYRYVKIGQKLLDRPGAKEVAGEVISIGTQVMCFVEPVQCANEFHLQSHAAAMSSGHIAIAMGSSMSYAIGSYWAGTRLQTVRENFAKSRNLMEKQNYLLWLAQQTPLERTMMILIGVEERQLPGQTVLGGTIPQASMLLYFQKLYLSFMFRLYEPMKAAAEDYFRYEPGVKSWSLMYVHTAQALHSGLAAYWLFRKSKDPKWADRATKAKFAMKKWADVNEWNFQSKLYLMEAEEAFSYKDMISATSLYKKAISSAREHRFINEEALAYELAGYFFMEIGQKDVSVEYFLKAHEKYHDWGAIAKANTLYESTMTSIVRKKETHLPGGQ